MNILDYKERKFEWIKKLAQNEVLTTLSFRINLPGLDKRTELAKVLFENGCKAFRELAHKNEWPIKELVPSFEAPEFLFVCQVKVESLLVKKVLIQLEEEHACGRLFDFDVYTNVGEPISRQALGYKQRTCFLCEENAFVCSRLNRHSTEELNNFLISKAKWAFDDMKEDI